MRNSLIYILVAVAAVALVMLMFRQGDSSESIPFNQVVEMARGNIGSPLSIEVSGDVVRVDDGTRTYTSRKESSTSVYEALADANADLNSYQLDVRGISSLLHTARVCGLSHVALSADACLERFADALGVSRRRAGSEFFCFSMYLSITKCLSSFHYQRH